MCENCNSLKEKLLNSEYILFSSKNTPLYTNDEIAEKIDGLIDLMYDPKHISNIEYQSTIFRFILEEFFKDANFRHKRT